MYPKKRREDIVRHEQNKKRLRKEYVWDCKLASLCKECGEKDPRTLDFHHRDPNEKSFNLSSFASHSIRQLKAEIEKCDVLCANCHRIHHYEERLRKNSDPNLKYLAGDL